MFKFWKKPVAKKKDVFVATIVLLNGDDLSFTGMISENGKTLLIRNESSYMAILLSEIRYVVCKKVDGIKGVE